MNDMKRTQYWDEQAVGQGDSYNHPLLMQGVYSIKKALYSELNNDYFTLECLYRSNPPQIVSSLNAFLIDPLLYQVGYSV